MITTKKFVDTRTGEVVERFSILDIKYMKELEDSMVEGDMITLTCECHFCDKVKKCNNSWAKSAFVCEECFELNRLGHREPKEYYVE